MGWCHGVTLTNNVVTLNEQDAEIINNSAAGFTALVTNSQFTSNENRGVAIFKRGSGSGQTSPSTTTRSSATCWMVGVYVVNTADADRIHEPLLLWAWRWRMVGLVTATPDIWSSL